MLAPVVVFSYNRLSHLTNTINSLKQNTLSSQTDLIIYSDGPSSEKQTPLVNGVRSYIKSINGFSSIKIVERPYNFGLANNIISGVSEVLEEYDKLIVLEDDLVLSPYFLNYMNDGLNIYADSFDVASIHGYVYPVRETLPETFFLKGADCLGWATWKRAWNYFEIDGGKLYEKLLQTKDKYKFDFEGAYPYTKMLLQQSEGKNSSWAVRWYASAFLNDQYTLYPGKSLVYHAGGDGTGMNTGIDWLLDVELTNRPINVNKIKVEESEIAYNSFRKYLYTLSNPSLSIKVKRRLKKYWNTIKFINQTK